MKGTTYFIGDVAEATGLSLRSLRYYEEAGLVLPAGRTTGGFRIYTDEAIARVRVIMQMKPLGFTLEEMRILLAALDAVHHDAGASDGRATVSMFSALADERCRHLREQLGIAEAFSARLKEYSGEEPAHPARRSRNQAPTSAEPNLHRLPKGLSDTP